MGGWLRGFANYHGDAAQAHQRNQPASTRGAVAYYMPRRTLGGFWLAGGGMKGKKKNLFYNRQRAGHAPCRYGPGRRLRAPTVARLPLRFRLPTVAGTSPRDLHHHHRLHRSLRANFNQTRIRSCRGGYRFVGLIGSGSLHLTPPPVTTSICRPMPSRPYRGRNAFALVTARKVSWPSAQATGVSHDKSSR